MITLADKLKPYYLSGIKILNKVELKNLPNETNIFSNVKYRKEFIELNKILQQITGEKSDIRKIGTIRENLLNLK